MEITETVLFRLLPPGPAAPGTPDPGPSNRPFPLARSGVPFRRSQLPRGEFLGLAVGAVWLLAALLA